MSEMGTFRIQIEIENPALPGTRLNLRVEPANRRLVDAGPAPAAVTDNVQTAGSHREAFC